MKRIIRAVFFIALATGVFMGCGNDISTNMNRTDTYVYDEMKGSEKHSIEVSDNRGIIKKCPRTAKSGDKVTIKTNSFMDAIPKINVNGNDIGEWNGNRTEYTFIMPDEDVKIITTLKSAGEI